MTEKIDLLRFCSVPCQHNDELNYRFIPFKMNYYMFNVLCEQVNNDLTYSDIYDKYILLRDLWSKMVSQVLEEYMQRRSYYGRTEKEIPCY